MYNDAPWLPESEELSQVHPLISNEVADRLGVASLRRSLLIRSADSIQLGLTGVLCVLNCALPPLLHSRGEAGCAAIVPANVDQSIAHAAA